MSLPDCELHHIDYVAAQTKLKNAETLTPQLESIVADLQAFESCRFVDLAHNEPESGLSWPLVARLLQITVDEMCRLDGSQAPVQKSIICSLLSTLSSHLAGNISTIVDPSFILPDLDELRVSNDAMDGHALMLALLRFNNSSAELNEDPSVVTSRECRAEDLPASCIRTDPSLNAELTSHPVDHSRGTTATTSEYQNPLFPLDAHILPNRIDAASVHVPLFVVADSTNIKYLMTSALYQRYIFFIDEPLVGIEVCSNSPVVQVHFGWIENKVPVVHIAYSTRDTMLGYYDLRELSAARAFAQLIFSLQVQAQKILQIMREPRIRQFCWRLDHSSYPKSREWNKQIMENVARWLRDLPTRKISSRSRSCPASHHHCSGADSRIGHRRVNSVTKCSLILDWDTHDDSIDRKLSLEEDEENFDYLTALYEQSLQQHVMLEAFDFERDVIFIGNVPPRKDYPNHDHMKTMHDLYTQFNDFVSIEKWKSSDSLSHLCSQALETQCSTLVEQNRGEQRTLALLDENLVTILEEKLDVILLPSHYFSSIYCEESDPNFYHHLWEYFFAAFCYRDSALIDRVDLRFDVKAHLSKNRHAEMLQDDQPSAVADAKKHIQRLSRDALSRCLTDAMSSFDDIVQEAHILGVRAHSIISTFCTLDDTIFSKMILQRAQMEPFEGLCDIIALRPAVFESPCVTPRDIPCPPGFAFVIPDSLTFSETTVSNEESQLFRTPQNRDHGHVAEHYNLEWRPLGAPTLPTDTKTSNTLGSEIVSSAKPNEPLVLPFVISITQETGETYWDVTQRLSAYIVSAVDMYAHLGIKDYPVWGVVIGGARCGTFMGWRSSVNDRAYVIQRAVRVYNITVPYEAMQFALFLLRVRESQRTLPCTDFIFHHLNLDNSTSPSSPVEGPSSSDVVLTMDSECMDLEGIWTSWMRAKQNVDVPNSD